MSLTTPMARIYGAFSTRRRRMIVRPGSSFVESSAGTWNSDASGSLRTRSVTRYVVVPSRGSLCLLIVSTS